MSTRRVDQPAQFTTFCTRRLLPPVRPHIPARTADRPGRPPPRLLPGYAHLLRPTRHIPPPASFTGPPGGRSPSGHLSTRRPRE